MDRPILFSAPMVRELLAGTKTQTRRAFSREWSVMGNSWRHSKHDRLWGALRLSEAYSGGHKLKVPWCHPDDEPTPSDECGIYSLYPPYEVGDRLWVKETFARKAEKEALYAADWSDAGVKGLRPWKPSIFMPRWASRLTLTVTDVRLQRLQECSEEDAIAEGVERDTDGWRDYQMPTTQFCTSARDSYCTLWDSINGKRPGCSWADNPWVVAVTFSAHRANIDALPVSGGRV